ncbi:hypothetical protein FIBSPDRAFT_1053680, partial [Athelia psychrophila]
MNEREPRSFLVLTTTNAVRLLPSLHSSLIVAFSSAEILCIQLARHDETLVLMLKGLIKRWWGTRRGRSSVIAFDNVDELLGVELE